MLKHVVTAVGLLRAHRVVLLRRREMHHALGLVKPAKKYLV